MRKAIIKNGLKYTLIGNYFLPNLALNEDHRPVGKWGRLHREFLEQEHPILFNSLVLSGRLWTYLADSNQQAQERLSLIVEQMKVAKGVTEDLKAAEPMVWGGAMNSMRYKIKQSIQAIEATTCIDYSRNQQKIC